MKNTVRLSFILFLLTITGCASTVNLDQRASEEMISRFSKEAHGQHPRLTCSHRLKNYVYQGYPAGLTGSEIKTTINIGETFCALLDQAGSLPQGSSGDPADLRLDIKGITFTYSYRGTSLLVEEGRDFDAVFILIKLIVESGSRTREYSFITEQERYDSAVQGNAVKYSIVNSALEDIIYQLYEKVYQDFF